MSEKFSRRGFIQGGVLTAGFFSQTAAAQERPSVPAEKNSNLSVEEDGQLKWNAQAKVDTWINLEAQSFDVSAEDLTLELLRKNGLTSCKRACGQGVCGACTVHVDGVPVNSCILPATAVHKKEVTTLEAYSDKPHPLQLAFLEEDALQCGFCTPGFLMEGIFFVDHWRERFGNEAPSREKIAEALAGHICRCGAYEGIFKAVERTCRGELDDAAKQGRMAVTTIRVDGWEKVTGQAKYTADHQLPNMLYTAVLRAPHANAQIKKINVELALQAAGVQAAHIVLFEGAQIRFFGQPIAAVAAESERQAKDALEHIEIEYAISRPAVGIKGALTSEAPLVYEEDERKDTPSAAEGGTFPADWEGNLRGPVKLHLFASPKKAEKLLSSFKASPKQHARNGASLVSSKYTSQAQCHSALEPHACIAHWESRDDGPYLEVWYSTQAVFLTAQDIAERWEIPISRVKVNAQYVGGGFGAKATPQAELLYAIELSRKTKRPVKVVWSREEELIVGGFRPSTEVELETITTTSEIQAISMRALSDSGVAVGGAIGILPRILYPDSPKMLLDWDVLTHGPPGRPFRGPGGPAALWALEQNIDQAAVDLGLDPIEARLLWDRDPTRQRLYRWAMGLDIWKNRETQSSNARFQRYVRGVGAAISAWPYFLNPKTQVELRSTGSGRFVARTSTQDIGQGVRSVISVAICEKMGLEQDLLEVVVGISDAPQGPPSGGSQSTPSVTPAAEDAASELMLLMSELAESELGLQSIQQVVEQGAGGIRHANGFLSWSELSGLLGSLTVVGRRRRDQGGYKINMGSFAWGKAQPAGLQIFEIELDTLTGKVKPLQGWLGVAAGRIVVPQLAKSQALGGMIQGLSYALYEERLLDPATGRHLSLDLNDYKILGLGDLPQLHVHFDHTPLDNVEGGACGIAELTTIASAAALGNAVYNATGRRVRDLPLRPDRILKVLS